jgi:aldehyde dehydrogenase (NAD+)
MTMVHATYIAGELLEGAGPRLSVEDPSYATEIAAFPAASLDQIAQAIAAARQAFDDGRWSALLAVERAAKLRRFVQALSARAERLIDLVSQEAGCPKASGAMNPQVRGPIAQAGDTIDLFLSLPEIEENPLPLAERATATGQFAQSLRRYEPIGVVAGIAAYNFPFYTALWKVIPALMTGNTIVLRPSPLTPLSAMILAEAAREAELPPGVLNIVLDWGVEGGQLLTTHVDIDMVAFTGSSHVGAQIMAQAAPSMKRLQLELGGKSAQIFLPDSVDKAAMAAMIVCVSHAGQGCALGTRIFVPDERKAEVLDAMAAAVARVKVGPADDPATQMGPLINAAQVARCERYVALAQEHGARVAIGGKRPAHLKAGHFFEPTVLDTPDNSNPTAQDEIFGPVVTVIGYRDLDHAIAMANDSRFGLSGYVHGQDKRAALKVALAIKSGTVNVNGAIASAYASAGGQRMSGIGRERGIEGLRLYQNLSVLNLAG